MLRYLASHERNPTMQQIEEARESFCQEAMASWLAYKETGRHLTGEEVRAWLNTWGTETEAEPPECHE